MLGVAVAVLVIRHASCAMGKRVLGGIVIRHAGLYDALGHRLLLGSLFRRIAADIAELATVGARVLEVGCGPGRLSILLACGHGLDVTGVDLDPTMIERARANAERAGHADRRAPSFVVGDVASLAFPSASVDLVVSTLSMHHWADPGTGLAEIGRVLRPGGRALIWDFRPGVVPFHAHVPHPLNQVVRAPLLKTSTAPWRWPWKFALTHRMELVRADDPVAPGRARSTRSHRGS